MLRLLTGVVLTSLLFACEEERVEGVSENQVRWRDALRLFHAGRYSDFCEIAAGIPADEVGSSYYIFVADSYNYLGQREKAQELLERCLQSYPDDPGTLEALGTLLALESANKKPLRDRAIRLWEESITSSRKTGGLGVDESTEYLATEILVLKNLSIEDSYPPVSPEVLHALEKLRGAGLFSETGTGRLVHRIALDMGADMLREDHLNSGWLSSILQADHARYLYSDSGTGFDLALFFEKITRILQMNNMTLDLKCQSSISGGKVHIFLAGGDEGVHVASAAEVVEVVNQFLARAGNPQHFFTLKQQDAGDATIYVLATSQEARKLKDTGLIELIH